MIIPKILTNPTQHDCSVESSARRKKWFNIARRADPPTRSKCFCCQDHFNLRDDMEHFYRYQMFGGTIKLKPNVLPHKFECQPNRALKCLDHNRKAFQKLNHRRCIDEEMTLEQDQQRSVAKENRSPVEVSTVSKVTSVEGAKNNLFVEDSESEMEVDFSASESILSENEDAGMANLAQLPQEDPQDCVCGNPKKMQKIATHGAQNVMSTITTPHMCDAEVQSTVQTTDRACSPAHSLSSNVQSKSSPSKPSSGSLYVPSSSDTGTSGSCNMQDESSEKNINDEMKLTILNVTRYNIMKDCKRYVGISDQCMAWLTKLLLEHSCCKEDHMYLTLTKIRLGDKFERLADNYGISESQASRISHESVRILSHLLKQLIYQPSQAEVQKNSPIPFRAYCNSVYVLMDAFEIQIQKPSNPILQVLTWSEYKKCNTIKYIIAITPDGSIVFISRGYGERISDIKLFEACGIMDILPEGCACMADRGFKGIEGILQKKMCKLIRPPSVLSTEKLSKAEVLETKRIASLRIHVERLIRRVREYEILKPHSCFDLKMLPIVDNIMYTACGLINLQGPLIKT
ncbi:hypothetical protein QAD02_011758 [Eretmocerus hayati]|uniref:Uncharacterized protein n=1 Tax=Eretmocerus hayati TaxID=131215 RepID=A0ACC2P0K6_9HYME|nr:hypothetical protein QAD02_011758 [Eretmocerus hayati]